MRVTVLGTGIMGAAMARSLAREGHHVTVWNRSPERAREVAGEAITAADSVAGAVTDAEVVLTVLFDAESVLAVADDLVAALGPDAVWLQTSTVGPDGMRRIAGAAAGALDRLVDAPVLGTRQPAEDGNLVVLLSGSAAARSAAAPVLDAIGSRVVDVGDEIGEASALKLVANSWVALVNAGTAQAVAMAAGSGLDPALFLTAIEGGPVDAPYVHAKGDLMIRQTWETPSFAVDGVVKDIGLMIEHAESRQVRSDLLRTLVGLYRDASAAGHGAADMAAVRAAFDA